METQSAESDYYEDEEISLEGDAGMTLSARVEVILKVFIESEKLEKEKRLHVSLFARYFVERHTEVTSDKIDSILEEYFAPYMMVAVKTNMMVVLKNQVLYRR